MKNFFIKSVFAFLFLANAMSALADGTINVSDGTGEGSGWNYESGTITISEAGTFTLTGSTTTNSVVIAVSVDTFNVTLENVSIETACPFYITPNTSAKNTTVNLTLTGVNTLTSKSGGNAGLSVHANAAVHIYGTGSLYATGSLNGEDGGAGIGSKYSSNSGKITVHSGTVTATCTGKSAAIGAGYHGSQASGPVTISGGVVCCVNKSSGFSIGHYNGSGGACYISGNAVVIVNSSIYDTNASHRTGGVLLEGDKCIFYGTDILLTNDLLLPTGKTLTVPEENSFTTSEGTTVTNNGTVIVDGTLTVNGSFSNNGIFTVNSTTVNTGVIENYKTITIYGSLTNSGVIRNHGDGVIQGSINGNPVEVKQYTVDISTVSQSGEGYIFANGVVTLTTADALYTLTGTSTTTRVSVAENITVNVIFQNLNIESTDVPFAIGASSNVKLKLEGTNFLKSTGNEAGLSVVSGTSIIIDGSGSLDVISNSGAGIGSTGTTGIITINNGIITTSSASSYGIGGNSGIIAINGGIVTATTESQSEKALTGIFTMNGDGVVFAKSVSSTTPKDRGLLFVGDAGTIYGTTVTIKKHCEIPEGKTLSIDGTKTLIVAGNKTLRNYGTIDIYGTLIIDGTLINNGTVNKYGDINGAITGVQPVESNREQIAINLSTVNAAGEGYELTGSTITLSKNNVDYTLTGRTSKYTVEIAAGLSVKVTLDNATIITRKAFYINPSSIAVVTLMGDNNLSSTQNSGNAGLGVPAGAKVIIDGTGSLVTGGTGTASSGGAGIGGSKDINAGVVIINGGVITARGYSKAAGIGGGYHSGYEAIEINGGFVTAEGGVTSSSTRSDGIGGYGDDILVGPFTMNGSAIVYSTNVRDKSPKQNGLLLDLGNCHIYGTEARISRSLDLPYGAKLTLNKGQKLTVDEGVTLKWGQNSNFTLAPGSTLVNNGVINGFQHSNQKTVNTAEGTVEGSGTINLETVPYDNRDRLYFRVHILANCLYDNSVTKTLSESEISTWKANAMNFEIMLEKHSPNVNVVVDTIVHRQQTTGSGTGNDNRFSPSSVPGGFYSKCMDIFVARPTGSPNYAAFYAGDYIHMTTNSGVPAMMHEYAHHVQSLLTDYNPDDGQSFEALYYRYDTMAVNLFWEGLIKDQGELWDGDDEWLYPDSHPQSWPEDVVFPEYGTINSGQTLDYAVFTGGSGEGTFKFSNNNWKEYNIAKDNGKLFICTFTPSDATKHRITQLVQLRFKGIKMNPELSIIQSDIALPQTPNPVVSIAPDNLPYAVQYKVQGANNSTYTTDIPTATGNYTVRIFFAGDDEYNETFEMVNFSILETTAIINPDTRQQIAVYGGEGVIRVIAESGVSNAVLRVYSLSGSLVASKYISTGDVTFPVRRGLYIINCEGVRKKILVR